MRGYWVQLRPQGGWLFPGRKAGEPITRPAATMALHEAATKAKLRKKVTPHQLPHVLSRLAAKNVPMLTIKELAGHQSLETTQRYMHLSQVAPHEGIRALEAESLEAAWRRGRVR